LVGTAALCTAGGLLAKKQIEEGLQNSAMDVAPDNAKWIDGGVDTKEAKATVNGTPIADQLPKTPGYEAAPDDLLHGWLEGFNIFDGPDTSVLEKGKQEAKPKSFNQIDQEIRRGQAPRGIERIDRGQVTGEQTHIHFSNGSALNIDGSWKEGKEEPTKEQREWLLKNGWRLPNE